MPAQEQKHNYPLGTNIGGYTLTEFCGAGGFAEVYLAEDAAGRKLALKISHDKKNAEKEFDGLKKLSDCRHPNLIEIKHLVFHQGYLFYTMDCADNAGTEKEYIADTLEYRIKQKRKSSAEEVYSIAEKMADVLGYLHKQKLIHRDVKPGNILFIKGEPVLTDIGLITTATPDTSFAGTPVFIPHYVFDGRCSPCAESDFYALGLTLQCALAGTNDIHIAKRRNDDKSITSPKESALLRLFAALDVSDDIKKVKIRSAEEFLECLHYGQDVPEESAPTKRPSAKTKSASKDYRILLDELFEQDMYTAPNIPEKKLKNALRSFAPGVKAEDVLLLVDDTAFGSSKEGVIITKDAVYGKEMLERPKKISLFKNTTVSVKKSKTLCINGCDFISLTQHKDKHNKLAALIRAVCASHSDSFDGVCKPEILPKQKSGCLKKIIIFAIFWIILGIIGNLMEEKEKKEAAAQEQKTVNGEKAQLETKSVSQQKTAAPQIPAGKIKAENMPEVKKLLDEYKLTKAETIKAEENPEIEGYNENIKMILDRITRKGNYSENDLAQLQAFLYARKRHFASQPSKHVQSILRGE